MWSPPIRFGNKLATRLLGGWTLSGFHRIQSGTPLYISPWARTWLWTGPAAPAGNWRNWRRAPRWTPSGASTPAASDFILRFFNPDAFVPVNALPRGIYGNVGRNMMSGPASVNIGRGNHEGLHASRAAEISAPRRVVQRLQPGEFRRSEYEPLVEQLWANNRCGLRPHASRLPSSCCGKRPDSEY